MVQFGDAITATTGLNTTLWKKCPRHSMDGTHTYIDTSNHCRLISALGPAYEAYPSSISFDVLATGSVNVRADALQSSGFHVFLLTWWPLGPSMAHCFHSLSPPISAHCVPGTPSATSVPHIDVDGMVTYFIFNPVHLLKAHRPR